MADGRLAVLLAHLAPAQGPASSLSENRLNGPRVTDSAGPLVIIGGVCLDIQAQPSVADVHRGTSVPGKIRQVPGGVGRNLAEALSALVPPERPPPVFVSLVGDDAAGSFLTASLSRLRLDLSHLLTCPGATTPCVSAVLDRGGEVAACVADVTAVEELLTPERLAGACSQQIQQACLVLAEANLSPEALQFVSRTAAASRVPLFLEPVSLPKAARLAASLPYATFTSPNAAELISVADEVRRAAGLPPLPRPNLPDEEEQGTEGEEAEGVGAEGMLRQLAPFAEVVLGQGTSCVVLTLGSRGAALVSLCDAEKAAAAAAAAGAQETAAQRRPVLAPMEACSRSDSQGHPIRAPIAMSVTKTAPHLFTKPCANRGPPVSAAQAAVGEDGPPSATGAAAPATLPGRQRQGQRRRYVVQALHLRALPAKVVSVNGAGDTLVAGMVAALLQRQEPIKALAYGMAAAKRTVESHLNVPDLHLLSLTPDAERIYATLRRHFFPSVLGGA